MDTHAMKTLRSTIPISALLLAAQGARALNEPADPPGNQKQVEEAEAVLPRVGTNQTPVMPTVPAVSVPQQPGLSGGQDWLKVLHESLKQSIEPSTLAEGAFVLDRLGSIVRGPNELLIFVPDKTTRQPGEGPVLLMPNRTLEQLESEWTGQQIELSGEIFDYHHRNQLLISAYRLAPEQSAQPPQPKAQENPADLSTPNTSDDEPPSLEADPEVRDLLKELNLGSTKSTDDSAPAHHRLETPPIQPARRSQVAVTDTMGGYNEGTLILRRESRMIRNSTGAWTVIFDQDDTQAPDTIELIVEPCRMLMRMETIAMETGDAGRLLVSGRVYTYKGNSYILPTLIQRVRPQEINSLQ